MTSLIWIDTETGGLDPKTDALLSVGLVLWKDGQVQDETEILIDAAGLRCTDQAMAVNRIDLDWHHDQSITRSEAAARIADWCERIKRPILCGHNVGFDIGFVRPLFTAEAWRKTFSHKTIDTMQILAFLGHAGLIPEGIGKLDQAMAQFGITMPPSERHTALADARATAHLYTAMLKLARERRS
jgi:DNA polymerase-3 subunit epsilon